MKKMATTLSVLTAFAVTLAAPMAAQAGSTGRRNTALVGTAASVYLLAKGKTVPGLVAGAGTAYAWKRYGDSRKSENIKRGYKAGYSRGYKNGKKYAYRHRR